VKIGVVINPRAGGGRMDAAWSAISDALARRLGRYEVLRTTRPGEGSRLARRLAEGGADLVIAAGGDGTISEVADGLMRAARQPELGIIPVGTGIDFPRSLELGSRAMEALEAIASGRRRQLDVGRISYAADGGGLEVRHFINEASFGLSGPVVRAVNAARLRGKSGKLTFLWHTLSQLLRYRPVTLSLSLEGEAAVEARVAVVAVCIGRYFGAGMMVAPDAVVDDGLFDVVMVRHASRIELVNVLSKAYSGGHLSSPLCTVRRARSVSIEPVGPAALVDIDGESPGRIPAKIEMLEKRLTLRG
jgi:YegS/Rv2252/BmrU family lipid kinase